MEADVEVEDEPAESDELVELVVPVLPDEVLPDEVLPDEELPEEELRLSVR